jgi:hypothetical protein
MATNCNSASAILGWTHHRHGPRNSVPDSHLNALCLSLKEFSRDFF